MRGKKHTGQRLLSLLLALTLVTGLLPISVWAEEGNGIKVSISVYNGGVLAKDKDGKAMLCREVAVQDIDQDGQYSLDEALQAAHAAYAPNGTADYGTEIGSYGLSVNRLWGVESDAVGFYKNHTMTAGVGDEALTDSDRVTAFLYYDTTGYSDRYSFFDKEKLTVAAGEEFELTLQYWGYDAEWNLVKKPVAAAPIGAVDPESGEYSVPDAFRGEHLFGEYYMQASTDTYGKVKVSIAEAGVYYVTAQHDSINYSGYDAQNNPVPNYLVPPLCVVQVLPAEDAEKAQALQGAFDQLIWSSMSDESQDSVTSGLTLASSLEVNGKTVTITWESTNPALFVSEYGGYWSSYVDQPAAQDAAGILTATLECEGASTTKEFQVTVKAEGVDSDKTSVVSYGALMEGIANTYTSTTDPWVVLDMKAYNGSSLERSYDQSSSVPARAIAEAALGIEVGQETLSAVDISGQYAIYTVPYLALAYRATGLTGTGAHTETALNQTMVEYLENISANYAGVDEIAPVLAALAPSYGKGDTKLDAAVDAGVAWLSQTQQSDGTFSYYGTSNANSTALAVVALSALGIDAHTDSRFVKSGKSAVEGLFSFALADNSGFGYKGNVTKNTLATEQGFRALVAYARMKETAGGYNIYTQAKDSTAAVTAPAITATGGTGGGNQPTPPQDRNIQITFTIRAEGEYWLNGKNVTVKENASVFDAFEAAIAGTGITYTGSSGYVASVTKDGVTLGEFSGGDNSGWLYQVNGTVPQVGMDSYVVSAGDEILFYYTTDWTTDPGAGSAVDRPGEPAAEVQANGSGGYEVTFPKGSRPAVVTLPDVKEGQVVVIVHPDGEREVVKKSLVENGTAYVLLDESCTVEIVDNTREFADVAADDWYKGAVDFVVSHGMFAGTSADTFEPETTMSRAMLACVLYQLEDAPESGTPQFYDVAPDAWYADAVAWAAGTGLVAGTGSGFEPDEAVTREQIAVILYQYAHAMGLDIAIRARLDEYRDGGTTSDWAEEAMSWAVGAGLFSGNGDGTLNPGGSAARAEVAAIMRQLIGLLVK